MQSALVRSAGQLQAAFTTKAQRPARRSVAVRAEEGAAPESKPVKVERPASAPTFPIGVSEQSLSYLNGTLPADFGFDPLGLSDPEGAGGFMTPEWLSYSEVIHARWAMLGAAGCIAPEILASAGAIPQSPAEVVWFRSGVIPPAGTYEAGYWADPWSLFFVEVILMQFAELKRLQDFRFPGSQGKQYFLGLEAVMGGSGNPAYPGGAFFNLFNFGKTPEEMKTLQTKELRNGRLAMLAMFGYGAQAVMTGEGPWANLTAHVGSGGSVNLLTNLQSAFSN